MNGWIKLHRQITEWEWYTDIKTFKLWMHLLLTCNIVSQKRVCGYTLQPGQLITTLPRLAAETGLSLQEIRTALKHLKDSGEVTEIVTNKFRLVTVEKWAFYQGETENLTDKQQTNNRQSTGVKKESKELNNILSTTEGKKKPKKQAKKQNRFINYTQSDYDFAKIEQMERDLMNRQLSLEAEP